MTDTTRKELQDFRDAVTAHMDGKPFEWAFRSKSSPVWQTSNPAQDYAFDFDTNLYRPKPEPKVRPWSKPEHVPGPVCWMRPGSVGGNERMVVAIEENVIWIHGAAREFGATEFTWSDLSGMEHSTDRKTWQPCTITEP